MDIQIHSQSVSRFAAHLELSVGKKCGSFHMYFTGECQIVVHNDSHRVWRGMGKMRRDKQEALEASNRAIAAQFLAMHAMIELAATYTAENKPTAA